MLGTLVGSDAGGRGRSRGRRDHRAGDRPSAAEGDRDGRARLPEGIPGTHRRRAVGATGGKGVVLRAGRPATFRRDGDDRGRPRAGRGESCRGRRRLARELRVHEQNRRDRVPGDDRRSPRGCGARSGARGRGAGACGRGRADRLARRFRAARPAGLRSGESARAPRRPRRGGRVDSGCRRNRRQDRLPVPAGVRGDFARRGRAPGRAP